MEKVLEKYEIALVMKPHLNEEEQQAVMNDIQTQIERYGGTITKVDGWGKRRLAYEIDHLNEGIYSIISFQAPADAPVEVKAYMGIHDQILRYILVRDEL